MKSKYIIKNCKNKTYLARFGKVTWVKQIPEAIHFKTYAMAYLYWYVLKLEKHDAAIHNLEVVEK